MKRQSAKRALFCLIYITATAVSASAFAQDVARPRTRPVETDSLNPADSEIPGAPGMMFSSEEAKKKAGAENAQAGQLIEAALKAELAAAAQLDAVKRNQAADKAWRNQTSTIYSDIGLMRKALELNVKNLNDYKSSLTVDSNLRQRAELTVHLAKVALSNAYVQQFTYHYLSQYQQAMVSARVLAEARVRHAEAALASAKAGLSASPYSSTFKISQADVDAAQAKLTSLQQELDRMPGPATQNEAKQRASELYNKFKAEEAGYRTLGSQIQAKIDELYKLGELVKTRTEQNPDVVSRTSEIQDAQQAERDAKIYVDSLTGEGVTALQLAEARLNVALARKTVGDLKRGVFSIYEKMVQVNSEAEALVSPLTEELAPQFNQKLTDYKTNIASWIAQSTTEAAAADSLALEAQNRYDLIVAAEGKKSSASDEVLAAEAAVSAKKEVEAAAQGTLSAMRAGKQSNVEIADARAALAKAKAETASAELALAQKQLAYGQASVEASGAINATEQSLLDVMGRKLPDTSEADAKLVADANASITVKTGELSTAASVNETAQKRKEKIEQTSGALTAANTAYNDSFKAAGEAQEAYKKAKAGVIEQMQAAPDANVLAQGRALVAAKQIKAQKAWLEASKKFVTLSEARSAASNAAGSTEAELLALAPDVGQKGSPSTGKGLATVAAEKAVRTWEEALDRTQAVADLLKNYTADMGRLTDDLARANSDLNSARIRIEKASASISTLQKEYDQFVADGKGAVTVADKRAELDGAKADLAAAKKAYAQAEVDVAQANLDRDTFEVSTDQRIVQILPFDRPDMRATDQAALASANAKLAEAARLVKIAEENASYSLGAVDNITLKSDMVEQAEQQLKAAEAEATAAAESKGATMAKAAGMMESAEIALADIASRVAPTLYADSMLQTYLMSKPVRKQHEVTKAKDLAAANNKMINARVAVAREEVKMFLEGIDLATAEFRAANARYQLEVNRRDAVTRQQGALALSAKESADQNLTDAYLRYEAGYKQLLSLLDQAIVVKEAYLAALDTAGFKDGEVYVDIAKTIDSLKEEKLQVTSKVEEVTAARVKRERDEAIAATAAIEDALSGRVRSEVSIGAVVKELAAKYDGQTCKSGDSDSLKCLICNVVMEMRDGEPSMEGKLLAARAVMMRYHKDLDYYSGGTGTVCGIVWKGADEKSSQFSWTRKSEAKKDRKIYAKDTEEITAAVIAYHESEMPYPEPITHFLSPRSMTGKMPGWFYTCRDDMQYKIGVNVACQDVSTRPRDFQESRFSSEARKRSRAIRLNYESYQSLLPPMPKAHKRTLDDRG